MTLSSSWATMRNEQSPTTSVSVGRLTVLIMARVIVWKLINIYLFTCKILMFVCLFVWSLIFVVSDVGLARDALLQRIMHPAGLCRIKWISVDFTKWLLSFFLYRRVAFVQAHSFDGLVHAWTSVDDCGVCVKRKKEKRNIL